MAELIIIRGLPGSGKSTKAKKEFPDYLHYEPDHLFCDTNGKYRFDSQIFKEAVNFVCNMVDIALSKNENVVVSDVFPNKKSYQLFLDIAKFHNAEVKIITCKNNYKNIHNVPFYIIERMKNEFEDNITQEG